MSPFDAEAELSGDSDVAFRLMVNSFVRMFWRSALLEETVGWLDQHGYQVVPLDASQWTEDQDFHRAIARALDFPSYYGHNQDAFNDCMRDVTSFDYGARADATGLVFVFTGYDKFAAHCPRTAYAILDILADQARTAALFGNRVLCLVQSDDPRIRFEPVGAMPVLWNDAEWADASRRPDPPI